jgi:hypothetical protein
VHRRGEWIQTHSLWPDEAPKATPPHRDCASAADRSVAVSTAGGSVMNYERDRKWDRAPNNQVFATLLRGRPAEIWSPAGGRRLPPGLGLGS